MVHMDDQPPQVAEKKYHQLDPKNKSKYIAAAILFAVLVLPTSLYLYYTVALARPAQCDAEKVFVIERGEGTASISQRLYDEGLVNSRILFNIYVVVNRLQSKLQAGTYTIPAGCSINNLAQLFQQGRSDTTITFLEGWRVEEVAQAASAKFSNVDYQKFVALATDYEGELFPDTYEFNTDVDEETIVTAMRSTFTTKTQDSLTDAALAKVGLTGRQVLIVASIVEREVAISDDRKVVAGILLKRLREDMTLGADATTQYAVAPKGSDWWPRQLSGEDVAVDSPYNTRQVLGLPPGPICNPGLSSIKAVLEAQNTPYYYYVTDGQGVSHFAKTLEEHNRNIVKYLNP
jgi:UPF0755 protein